MRRDWILIKKLLLKLEGLQDYSEYLMPDMMEGYDRDTVLYHMELLNDAGLIKAEFGFSPNAYRLTWQGHEFLDNIRDDRMWNQIVKIARQKGLELTFEAIKAIASGIIRGLV